MSRSQETVRGAAPNVDTREIDAIHQARAVAATLRALENSTADRHAQNIGALEGDDA